MKAINENTSIREAYLICHPHDELAKRLNDVTFYDLFRCLDNYQDVYEFIGIYDSFIRENLFSMLAVIMDVEYDVIYDQWMKAA
jgi:hypothetical protein